MKVYITYFRYDRGESYSIYHMDKTRSSAIQHYKKHDLPRFLGYGPDDVSQLYLAKCDLTKSDYDFLKGCMEDSDSSDIEFYGIMEDLHDTLEDKDILYSDTGDTNWEVFEFFKRNYDPKDYLTTVPEDEDDLKDELQKVLFDDDQVYDSVLKEYIRQHY